MSDDPLFATIDALAIDYRSKLRLPPTDVVEVYLPDWVWSEFGEDRVRAEAERLGCRVKRYP